MACIPNRSVLLHAVRPRIRPSEYVGGLAHLMLLGYVSFVLTGPIGSVVGEEPELLRDDYSNAEHPSRKAMRGEWTVKDGTAFVKQDAELYKKFKNHGPIMVYEIPHTDASSVVEFRPRGCKTVVFTMDAMNGGHAFRVIMRSEASGQPTTIQTYTEKQDNGKAKPIVLSRKLPSFKEGEWNQIMVVVKGDDAIVEFGGQQFEVKHARIKQGKKMVKLGFSFGELAIRKFELTAI